MAETSLTTYLSDRKQARLESGQTDTLSSRSYNVLMCGVLAYGFALNALIVYLFAEPLMQLLSTVSPWVLLVAYLVCSLAGVLVAARSTNPFVSFLGYNLVVLPIGVMLALLLPQFPVQTVTKAMTLTAMVTLTLLVLAIARPQMFLGLGKTLFIGLLAGIVGELVATFLLGYRGSLFDWFFVVLFSGYIGYDISRSQAYPKTADNAVDCALDIYLDIINVFIRILSLLARRD